MLDQWKRQLKKDSESMRADANRKMLRQVGGPFCWCFWPLAWGWYVCVVVGRSMYAPFQEGVALRARGCRKMLPRVGVPCCWFELHCLSSFSCCLLSYQRQLKEIPESMHANANRKMLQ
jgi:hypothetical protein